MKKIALLLCAALIVFAAGSAWAASPDDALTERPDSTFRLKLRLNNPENVKNIFDHPLIALYSAFFNEEKTAGVLYALDLALGFQPESVVFVVGKDQGQQFLQMAVSMSEKSLPQLNSIELGKATKEELAAFLAGWSQQHKKLDHVISEGLNGPYYLFRDTVFLTARENLLLIALSLEDLSASLDALDKAGISRFVFRITPNADNYDVI